MALKSEATADSAPYEGATHLGNLALWDTPRLWLIIQIRTKAISSNLPNLKFQF